MKEMYKGVANSPETTITNDINNLDTIIYVLDETRIPELPNLMVLGNGISAETVKVLSIDGNALTVERGFQGAPKSWNAGAIIARNFTEYDYNSLVENIKELDEEKTTATVTDNKIDNHNTNGNSHENIIGLLSSLTTDEKADLVSAINEVKSQSNEIATEELPKKLDKTGGELTGTLTVKDVVRSTTGNALPNSDVVIYRSTTPNEPVDFIAKMPEQVKKYNKLLLLVKGAAHGGFAINSEQTFSSPNSYGFGYYLMILERYYDGEFKWRESDYYGLIGHRPASAGSAVTKTAEATFAKASEYSQHVLKIEGLYIPFDFAPYVLNMWNTMNSGPFYKGTNSPEGVVTAPVGAIYQRTNGGNSTTLYVKELGTGNTGWKAVQTA